VNGAVGLHFFDLLEAGNGAFDGAEIGQRAAEPAFGDVVLAASLGGFADGFLGLLFRADEENGAALSHGGGEKVASGLQLSEGFAEINNVNPVAGFKDEWLHLGIPTFGLMTKMDARVQQFLKTNTKHDFSFC